MRGYVFLVTAAAVAAVTGACSDDDSTVPGSGSSGAAAGSGSLEAGAGNDGSGGMPSDPIPGTSVCGGCADYEGCVVVRVSRNSDASLPWTVSPDLADGVGTLVVSLQYSVVPTDDDVYATVPDVSFVSDGTKVDVPLCAGSLGYFVDVFLDDNENAAEGATDSDDPADACPRMTGVVNSGIEDTRYYSVVLTRPCG
jgi:hypothetical protein